MRKHHIYTYFVPYITGSKRGLDTRVSLKSALAAEGFTGGTRGATEWNQWIAAENQKLAMVMEQYGVKWLQKDNAQLEIQQEKLRSNIDQMVQSEKLLQRDV